MQRRYAPGRSTQVLRAGRDRSGSNEDGNEPVAVLGAGLPSHPEAGAHDRGPGGEREHRAESPGGGVACFAIGRG